MSQNIENRTVKIFIDDQDVQKKLDRARESLDNLKAKAAKADVGSKAFKETQEAIEKTQKQVSVYEGQLSGKFGATLTQLKAQQKQLNRELANLPIELRAASEQAKMLSLVEAELGKVKKEGKGAVDELRNFGPLGNQIADIWQGFSDGIGKGIGMLKTLRGAIMATGIGALLVAVISLVEWFKRTDDGANALDAAFRAFRATLDVVLNRIWNFRDTLRDFVSNPVEFFKNLGNDIKNAAKEAGSLAYVFDELDDRRRKMEETASELDRQITQYVRQSKNITLSFTERIALIDKASALEKEKLAAQIGYQNDLIAAIERENALKKKSGTLTDADKDKLSQAIVQKNNLLTDSIRLEERIANDRDKYFEAEIEQINKSKDAKAKAAAADLKTKMDAFSKEMQLEIQNAKDLELLEKELMGKSSEDLINEEIAFLEERQKNWDDFNSDIIKAEEDKYLEMISLADQYSNQAVKVVSMLNGLVFAKEEEKLRRSKANYDRDKANLDSQLAAKKISQEEYDNQINALKLKSENEEKELRLRQATAEKRLAVFQATIQAAMAVLKAIVAPTPSNIVAAVVASVQAGVVAATPLPAFAKGTNFAPGGLALVGEEGPELVDIPRGSKVFTASQTNKMLGVPEFNFGRINDAARNVTNNTVNNYGSGVEAQLLSAIEQLNRKLSQPILAQTLIGEKEIYTLRKEINNQSSYEKDSFV